MANLSKMTRTSCNNLFNHYERKNGIKFGNQDINKERSYMNYNLAPIKNLSQNEILNKRLSEVKVLNREDVNVMCSWIVTLPKTIEENSKEEYKFFEKTYEFLKNMYGEKNIISSYVHKDEKTPHMHFAFIPIVIDRKKGIEKVSAYELLTRNHLKQFHNKLANYLNEYFQRDIGILNGATESGNKTVLELKNKDLEKEIDRKKIEIENLKEEKEYILNLVKTTQIQFLKITKKVKERNIHIEELEEINNNLEMLKTELKKTPIFNVIKKNKIKKEYENLKEEYNAKKIICDIKENSINEERQKIIKNLKENIKLEKTIVINKLENNIYNVQSGEIAVINNIIDENTFQAISLKGLLTINCEKDSFEFIEERNNYFDSNNYERDYDDDEYDLEL